MGPRPPRADRDPRRGSQAASPAARSARRRVALAEHSVHEHGDPGQHHPDGARPAPDRSRHHDRPRPPAHGRHRPGARLLCRRPRLRRRAGGARRAGLGHDRRHPVRVGRRLSPPPRLQHLEVGRRRPAARRRGGPAPRRDPLPDARGPRRRAAAAARGRLADPPGDRPRHARGDLHLRPGRQRPRALLGPLARRVAADRRGVRPRAGRELDLDRLAAEA